LNMDEDDELLFTKVVALGCGESVQVERGLEGLIGLGRMADQYQMEAIQGEVEDAVINRLTVESCGPILATVCGSGLVRVDRASRKLALREFDQFAECAGFMEVSEEALGSLLDDDALVSEGEERVLRSVVRWMEGGAGGATRIRGEGLLRKVRFPFMAAEFLADQARGMLPESSGLEGLVLESGLLRGMPANLWAGRELRYLDARVLSPRRGRGVCWAEYEGGGERRLATGQWACAVSAHGRGLVCGGLHDGSIRVWNRATLRAKRTLPAHTDAVTALVSVGERLVSGSDDRRIRVWDAATWRCEATLEGHADSVRCLAVSGGRLVSGSWDGTARVWRVEGPAPGWRCERTLAGHGMGVNCLAAWGGKAATGSDDATIRVWDVAAGAHEQTLAGHGGEVVALVAVEQRLLSASLDKTVRVWSMADWACVQAVRAYPAESGQFIRSLAVSGSTLVGGSSSDPLAEEEHEARVWDLETLEPLHALRQPAGCRVWGLASDGGEVWGVVGEDVVVWGRRR
jgi:WD40 repeat protein